MPCGIDYKQIRIRLLSSQEALSFVVGEFIRRYLISGTRKHALLRTNPAISELICKSDRIFWRRLRRPGFELQPGLFLQQTIFFIAISSLNELRICQEIPWIYSLAFVARITYEFHSPAGNRTCRTVRDASEALFALSVPDRKPVIPE